MARMRPAKLAIQDAGSPGTHTRSCTGAHHTTSAGEEGNGWGERSQPRRRCAPHLRQATCAKVRDWMGGERRFVADLLRTRLGGWQSQPAGQASTPSVKMASGENKLF